MTMNKQQQETIIAICQSIAKSGNDLEDIFLSKGFDFDKDLFKSFNSIDVQLLSWVEHFEELSKSG